MTPRAIRRAAEHKARKQAAKAARQAAAPQSANLNIDTRQATVSEAQLTANQANAQLSTGPTSEEGKAISSRNHTTHGLTAVPCDNFKVLPTENQASYNQSLADYRKEWKPETATEHDLVTQLVTHAWLRDRAIRLQNQILEQVGYEIAVDQRKDFALFHRYYTTHARAYSRALSEIMRLKNFKLRQAAKEVSIEIRFESQKQKTELHAAKLGLIEARKQAIKQRNQPADKPETAKASAASQSNGQLL